MHLFKGIKLILFILLIISLQARAFTGLKINQDSIFTLHYVGEESIDLKGNWAFYWKSLYTENPEILSSNDYLIAKCPDIWNNLTLNNEKLPGFGFGTYVLQIHANRAYDDLAFEIPEFYSEYRLIFNGKEIASNGIVGKSKEGSSLEWLPKTVATKVAEGDNLLVLEVSNYQHAKGGFFAPIKLGKASYLFQLREFQVMTDMFIIGSLFIIGAFFLGMFLFWRQDRAILFYSLFSIFYAIRFSAYGLHLLNVVISGIPWQLSVRIEYISFYMSWIFLIYFFYHILKGKALLIVRKISLVATIFIVSFTLIMPLEWYSKLMVPYTITGLMILLYIIYIISNTVKNKGEGSTVLLFSGIVLIIAIFFRALMHYQLIPDNFYLLNLTFLSLFLVMSFILAERFALAFRTVEKLQVETLKQKEIIEEQYQRIQKLNKVQSRWFTNIAHELRTPVTLVLGPVKSLLNYCTTSNVDKKALDNVILAKRNSERLLKLINEILDISKIESGQLSFNLAPKDLSELIKECIQSFEGMAIYKGITIHNKVTQKMWLMVDEKKITNIINNLLSNALKFTHKGGSITISPTCPADGEFVHIYVADTGEGIGEKDLNKIFERYYQSENGHKNQQGGTGIGLSLSQEIAKLHGGYIAVESTLGSGSTFTLALPKKLITNNPKGSDRFIQEEPDVIELPRNFSYSKTGEKKSCILLVEDNVDMSNYIVNLLGDAFEIIEKNDGQEALHFLETRIPDLIISDIMMPRIDGIQLAKMVKENEKTRNIPFIMLTAKVGETDRLEGLRIGIDDYISKPFHAEELHIRIENLLRNYGERIMNSNGDNKEEILSHTEMLLTEIRDKITTEIGNCGFGVRELASEVSMSESTLNRLLKKNAGMTAIQFIREIRLTKALIMLENKQKPTIKEVAHSVGFENTSHFTRLFIERFGKKPSEFM